MNGFNRIDIPYDLPNRKNKLNNFENFAFQLLNKVENIIDVCKLYIGLSFSILGINLYGKK